MGDERGKQFLEQGAMQNVNLYFAFLMREGEEFFFGGGPLQQPDCIRLAPSLEWLQGPTKSCAACSSETGKIYTESFSCVSIL